MIRRCLYRGGAALLGFVAVAAFSCPSPAEEQRDCNECHEGEQVERLADEFDHEPFARGDCYACHVFHGFEPRPALSGSIHDVCLDCHPSIQEVPADLMHGPMGLEGSCALCHDPHSAAREFLLLEPIPELCVGCHDGPGEDMASSHPPFADGDCRACHDPHGTYFANLLQLPTGYTCQGCHEGIVPAAGPEVMHTADETTSCENCHSPHESENPYLLLEPAADLCAGCHDVEPSAAGWHGGVAEFGCGGCHDPHFDVNQSDVPVAETGYCAMCHDDVLAKIELETPHPVAEDCMTCHEVHGRLVRADIPALCGGCHDADDHPRLEVPVARGCTSCHDPHGTDTASLIMVNQHVPFAEGDCSSCHDPDDVEILRQDDLCLACHDEPEMAGAHAVRGEASGTLCVDCHSPHAAGKEFLIRGISPASR